MALVIYHALDYTHSEDEERLISPDLEGLITEMTSCDTVGELFLLSELVGEELSGHETHSWDKHTHVLKAYNLISIVTIKAVIIMFKVKLR